MSPATTDLHGQAVEHFSAGRAAEAIDLLRGAIDPEPLNDLAVMLAETGDAGAARDVLGAVLRLAPDHAAAAENLRALPDPMGEARRELLQLVSECQRTHLADNVDHFFSPWGAPLPDPAEAGGRLEQELDILARCRTFWRALGDENSRALFLRFLAYRALGPAHVRLELEPEAYRTAIQSLTAQALRQSSLMGAPGMPFEWQLHLYDLAEIGFPLRVLGQPLPLASTFLFSQYGYRDAEAGAAPRHGDVAIDAGGCWGESALWLAHMVGPQGQVHSFEPVPKNRAVLEQNVGLNPHLAGRVRVWDAPLGGDAGEPVWIRDRMAAGSQLQGDSGGDAIELRLRTIDELVANGAVERVDFLKVDVEGVDLTVLQGAAETIRAQRPRLALACYHEPDDLAVLPDFVASLGVEYRWYLQCSTMTHVDTVAFAVPV